jgi:hypothetical protein
MPIPTAESYKEIARQYADYNDPQGESKNADISPWKYFFTDVFYRGKYARYALRDWLAGGVKNNFLFGLFPKSDHAEFIALIDCICKFKKEKFKILPEEICQLRVILYGQGNQFIATTDEKKEEENDAALIKMMANLFLAHFEEIQKEYTEHSSTSDKIMLRELKIAINNFLQKHKVLKRIEENPNTNPVYIIKLLDPNYYRDREYFMKESHRKIKTSNKRWAKGLGFLAGVADIFINFMGIWMVGGLVAAHIPIIAPLIIPLAIFGAISGFHSGFNVFSENIYKNLKEIRRNRFFKDKDEEKLPASKKIMITLFSLFACAAGFCAFALTTYSVSTIFSIPLLTALPIAIPFALPLAIGLMFMYIDNIRGCILNFNDRYQYFRNDYWPHVKPGELLKDTCKLLFAFTLTALISVVGFFLYLTKGTFIMAGVATKTMIAGIFSGINSLVKLIFGTNKVRELIEHTHTHTHTHTPQASSQPLTRLQEESERMERHRERILRATAFGNGASKGGLYAYTASATLGLAGSLAFITGILEAIYIAAPWLVLRKQGKHSFVPAEEEKASPASDEALPPASSRNSGT